MAEAAPDELAPARRRLDRWLTIVLIVTVLDTALFAGWVEPGTGLCSWSASVDCDIVLQTREARAFYVPNAILGLGCYSACLWWWLLGRRLPSAYERHVMGALAVWLGIASLFTLWFWWP